MKSILIIGFGNMGEALVAGLRQRRKELGKHPLTIFIAEKDGKRRSQAQKDYGAMDYGNVLEGKPTERQIDLAILAIKPQEIAGVVETYRDLLNGGTPVISLAAGLSLERLGELLPNAQVIRFMPSLAARVGRAVTAVACPADCDISFKANAMEIAESIGMALEMPESFIPALIGISGSAIAYVYEFIHALALGGVREGFNYELSLRAVLNVMEGATATVRLAEEDGLGPEDLVTRVCSPGGTTIEGIRSLHGNSFISTVMEAVSAAASRARELESSPS